MSLWRYGTGVNNILVIGKGDVFKNFVNSIDAPARTGYKVAAVATNETPSRFKGKMFLDVNEALEQLSNLKIHTILYIGSSSDSQAANMALAAAQAHHTAFKFVPTHDGILSNNIEVDLFQGLPVVSVHQTSLTGWGRIAKRIFDIFASLFGLIILSPLFIILGALVFVADGGKPIFKHKRLSRFDTEVGIYKFRSMSRKYSGLEPEEAFAKMGKPDLAKKYRDNGDYLKNDPRVTKVGKFLRKTSLDELPQLLNVLKGDISLVGPRALAPAELKNYPYKNLILSVKSGLTGLAQISGRREISFEERRTLDLYYVQNWSFFMDIKIIFRTIIMVLTGRGAQ
jgi:exopolysaccharide biosynthesis polyprenyl glycosylphosphotransferase